MYHSETDRAIAAQEKATDVIVDKVQESRDKTREDIESAETKIIDDNAKCADRVENAVEQSKDDVQNTVENAKEEIIEKTATKEDLEGLEERLGEKVAEKVATAIKKAREEELALKTDDIKPTNLNFDGGEEDDKTLVSTLDSSSAVETECEEKPGGFRKAFASAKKLKLPFRGRAE